MKRSTNAEKAPGRDDITARTLRNDQNLGSFGREWTDVEQLRDAGHNLDTAEYLGLSVGRGLDFQAHVAAAPRAAMMKFHRQRACAGGDKKLAVENDTVAGGMTERQRTTHKGHLA
ncbi:hypothetical protein RUM44_007844 [Polyplax serrata]|uniref:Uncharacterized protein n=1 Tax=Polyplax serrata TaxID=468196 RepID=A0ABR1BAR7_POLSC